MSTSRRLIQTTSAAARMGWRGELPVRYEHDGRRFESTLAAAAVPGMDILDVGAGASPTIDVSARPLGVRYVGLDVSDHELAAAPPGSYDEVVIASVTEALPELEGTFDLAVSRFALEHVAPLEATLRNVLLYLRPGGRFIALLSGRFSVPSLINRALPHRFTRPLLKRLYGRAPESVFPARYDNCWHSALVSLLARDWTDWEVFPAFVGGRYFLPSRILAAGYLAYEEWALAAGHPNLAPYYVIDARAPQAAELRPDRT